VLLQAAEDTEALVREEMYNRLVREAPWLFTLGVLAGAWMVEMGWPLHKVVVVGALGTIAYNTLRRLIRRL
jgi:hypothetical protein